MNKLLIFSILAFPLLTGCIGSVDSKGRNGAVLVEQGTGEIELRFWKRSWGGLFGVHGYVGYVTETGRNGSVPAICQFSA